MKIIRLSIVCAVFLLAMVPSIIQSQTVFAEDFETPDTANYITFFSGQMMVTADNTWSVTLNSIDLYEAAARAEAGAFDGGQAVDLTGSPDGGVMEAVFGTTPGMAYALQFHYARNSFLGAAVGEAKVEVFGSSRLYLDYFQHDPALHVFDEYLMFSGAFIANSTESTLRFSGLNPGVAGVTIDGINISVTSLSDVTDPLPSAPRDEITSAHPNPFNPKTSLEYAITEPGRVEVTVYDISGRVVRILVSDDQEAGRHTATWDGTDRQGGRVASGVYRCVLSTTRGTTSRNVVLLK